MGCCSTCHEILYGLHPSYVRGDRIADTALFRPFSTCTPRRIRFSTRESGRTARHRLLYPPQLSAKKATAVNTTGGGSGELRGSPRVCIDFT